MKTFFNEYESYGQDPSGNDARTLLCEVDRALNPIFNKYLAKGYSVREIEMLIIDAATNKSGELRIIRASEKRIKERLDKATQNK